MAKYIKPIITKSEKGNVKRIDFTKTNQKPLIDYNDSEVLKKVIKQIENNLKKIAHLIKITASLSKYKIRSFSEISNLKGKAAQKLLVANYIDVMNILPIVALNELEEHSTDYILSKKDSAFNKIYQLSTHKLPKNEDEWTKKIEEEAKTISLEDAQIEHQNQNKDRDDFINSFESYKPLLNKDKESEQNILDYVETLDNLSEFKNNIRKLDDKKLEIHYENVIKTFVNEKESTEKILSVLKNIIYEAETSKGLATPNDLRIATMGTKQDLKWRDIDKQHQDKVRELLKSTAPEILSKLEDDENPNEIISQFIGIKLVKNELRILKTLRAIVDRFFKLGVIQDYTHKTKIYTNDFYKEYGLTLRPQTSGYGYDDNQTNPLRKILFGSGNLTKRIFFNDSKNQRVMVTAFILKLEWEPDNNYFEVMLDDIIFVKDKANKYSYYYENLKGFNRLMELMPNSDSAFELHEYLEYSIKEKNQEFGLTKLLNASPTLTKRYKKDRNGTIKRLEKVLDEMIEAKTLITTWKKVDGKNEIKYILTNIYKEGKGKLKLVDKISTKNKQ